MLIVECFDVFQVPVPFLFYKVRIASFEAVCVAG
jgi:hypothetical protein